MTVTERLDTGMTAAEVVVRASEWWDKFGRHHIPPEFNTEEKVRHRKAVANKAGVVFPGIVLRSKETVIPTGLLEGKAWDELERDEQRQICKTWHHHFVRVPQREGGVDDLPTLVDQVLAIRCDSDLHPKADRDEEAVFRGRTQSLCFHQAKQQGWLISPDKDICPTCMNRAFVAQPEGVQ